MRRDKDNRKDSLVKEELYLEHVAGNYEVAFVVDDRNQVVAMWRSLGLSCFQVAEETSESAVREVMSGSG